MTDEDPDVVQHDDEGPPPPRKGKAKIKVVITNPNGQVTELDATPKRAQFVPQMNGTMLTLFIPGQKLEFAGPTRVQPPTNILDASGNPARVGSKAPLYLPAGMKRIPPGASNSE